MTLFSDHDADFDFVVDAALDGWQNHAFPGPHNRSGGLQEQPVMVNGFDVGSGIDSCIGARLGEVRCVIDRRRNDFGGIGNRTEQSHILDFDMRAHFQFPPGWRP